MVNNLDKNKLINKDMKINVFNLGWWIYIISTIIVLFILHKISKSYDVDTKRRMILVLSIIEYIILRIYKHSLKSVYPKYNFYNELPCYLCNQSTILCIVAAITNNSTIMGFCTTFGFFGALLALFMPDKYYVDKPFFSRQALGFYGYHCLLVISCLSFYLLGLYKPNPLDALRSMPILFLLTCISHLINIILRKTGLNPICNYVFTIEPDNDVLKFFYNLFPVKMFYLLPIMFIFGLCAYIFLSLLP